MINPAFIVAKFTPLLQEAEKIRNHYKGKIVPDHLASLIIEFNRVEKSIRIVEVKHAT